MVKVKREGLGTLCDTCKHSTIARNDSQALVYCTAMGMDGTRINFPVTDCSAYYHKKEAALYQMEEIAWILVTRKSGKEVGFVTAERYEKLKKEGEVG